MPGSDALSGGAGMAAADPADAAAAAVLSRAWAWLNAYCAGQAPCWLPPLHMEETALSHAVWAEALTIPAGGAVELATFARRVAVRPGALDDGVPLGAAAGSGAAAGVVGTDPGAAASVAGVAAGCEAALGDAFERAAAHACGCAVDGALARAVNVMRSRRAPWRLWCRAIALRALPFRRRRGCAPLSRGLAAPNLDARSAADLCSPIKSNFTPACDVGGVELRIAWVVVVHVWLECESNLLGQHGGAHSASWAFGVRGDCQHDVVSAPSCVLPIQKRTKRFATIAFMQRI